MGLRRPVARRDLGGKPLTLNALILFVAAFPLLEGYSNAVTPVGTRILGGVVAAIWIYEILTTQTIRFYLSVGLLGLFLCWGATTSLWAQDSSLVMGQLFALALAVLLYWIVVDVAATKRDVERLMVAFMVGVALLLPSAIKSAMLGQGYDNLTNRFTAIGSDPNNFGVVLMSCVPIALYFAERAGRKTVRVAAGGFAGLAGAVGLATASRSALLALALVLIAYLLLGVRKKVARRTLAITVLVLLTGGLLAWYIVPDAAISRLAGGFWEDQGGGRLILWRLALELGSAHPLGGVGLGNFVAYSGGVEAHNTFFLAFAETGVIGLVLWILMWSVHAVQLLRRSLFRGDRLLRKALFASMMAVLSGALTLNWQARKPLFLIWGLIAAVVHMRPHWQSTSSALRDIRPERVDALV